MKNVLIGLVIGVLVGRKKIYTLEKFLPADPDWTTLEKQLQSNVGNTVTVQDGTNYITGILSFANDLYSVSGEQRLIADDTVVAADATMEMVLGEVTTITVDADGMTIAYMAAV